MLKKIYKDYDPGLLVVAGLFLGMAGGFFMGNVAIGLFLGMGIGFLMVVVTDIYIRAAKL